MTKSLAVISSVLIGVASVSFPVLAEQQTLRTCREEWRANQTALRANGMTQTAYVADCLAHAAKVGAASAAPASADTREKPTATTAGPQSPSDQCWQTGSDGWTVICSTPVTSGICAAGTANGTCIFYVSATGNDRNNCRTTSTPCRTLANGKSKMRNGKPDWLLLKEGDTWTDQSFECMSFNGQSATAPALVGSYDPATPTIGSPGTGGARPIVKPNPASPSSNSRGIGSCGGGSASGKGDFIAVIGIDFYNYTHDPANIGSGFAVADGSNAAIPTISGTAWQNSRTWLLIENNRFRFFGDGINTDATSDGSSVTGTLRVRRNVVIDSWAPQGHSQGMHHTFNYTTSTLFEENLWDHNGWNETLITPFAATINIGTSTITWTRLPMYNDPFHAPAGMRFKNNGDALPTGLSFNTVYYVINASGTSFQLSTDNIKPITLSGTQSGTHMLAWDAPGSSPNADTFNHNIYMDSQNTPPTVVGEIITNASNVGIQGRNGGTMYHSLIAHNPSAGFMGGVNSVQRDNLYIDGAANAVNVQSDGGNVNSSAASAFTHNLIVNAAAGASASPAISISNAQDDCGRITFTIANPSVASFPVGQIFNGQTIRVGLSDCGGTLPASVPALTDLFTSNASHNPVPGGSAANISLSPGGALINTGSDSQSGTFRPQFIAYNNSVTNNVIYNWGDATGNANIVDAGELTSFTPANTNNNSGGGGYPAPTRSIGSYNAQITGCGSLPGGCTATMTAFLTSAREQRKGNWNDALKATSVNNWIGAGFNFTFN